LKTDNAIAKRKTTKGKTIIYKAIHRQLKIAKHDPHFNPRGTLEVSAVPLHVA
jgi:hypothetical protein